MNINCLFSSRCSKYQTPKCSPICMAYTFLHGEFGNKGLWRTRNVPSKYEGCTLNTLPKLSPASTDALIRRYITNIVKHVKTGTGVFLYSAPTPDNKFGTGNGKTTSACTAINDFVVERAYTHLTTTDKLTHRANPALFVKSSEFQNMYNAQFRGTQDMQQEASLKYYRFKQAMMNVELLAIDDIAIRTGTEAFLNEMYEIIDHRAVEELATIFTSNIPLADLASIYGERIVSRIQGMSVEVPFNGKDNRKKI